MVEVTVYQNDRNEYVGFRTKGHAGYAEEGQDIVCAAASVLVINTINAIEKFTDTQTSVLSDDTEGVIEFEIKGKLSEETTLLLNTMVLGLQDIEESYKEYIDLIFKEV